MGRGFYDCTRCRHNNTPNGNCVLCDRGDMFQPRQISYQEYWGTYARKSGQAYCQADIDMTKATLTNIRQAINPFAIEKVHFNNPATVVLWKDGTKTVVKCGENDRYDPEKGLAMAIAKKALGNQGNYYNEIRKWVEPEMKLDEAAARAIYEMLTGIPYAEGK